MVSSNLVDWQKVTFEDAFADITAKATKVDQSEFLHSGKFPIVDQGQNFIAGYTDDEKLVWGDDLPVVIFGDHTRILKYVDFPFVLGADGTKVLKPNKDILPLFAYYQLLSFDIPSAGYSRHFKFLKDYKFQYPSMDEQKRIASLLARADRLRQLRRTAHDLENTLIQSVFFEMFGDPATNSMGWEVETIQDVVINYDSKRVPLEESVRAKRQGKYPYYGATGIMDYIDEYIFDQDMLLIAEDGKNLLNRTKPLAFMATGKYWVNNHSHVVSSAGRVNLRYLETALNMRDISSYVTGIDQFKLNRANLDIIPIQSPPLSLQEEFAGVVRRVESLRGRMSEAERQVEGLFESLLAEAFNE